MKKNKAKDNLDKATTIIIMSGIRNAVIGDVLRFPPAIRLHLGVVHMHLRDELMIKWYDKTK